MCSMLCVTCILVSGLFYPHAQYALSHGETEGARRCCQAGLKKNANEKIGGKKCSQKNC